MLFTFVMLLGANKLNVAVHSSPKGSAAIRRLRDND